MKYCITTTINHPKAKQFSTIIDEIFDVLHREGCVLNNNSPFKNKSFKIIDGDKLEEKFCFEDGRNLSCKNKSVDIIFGFIGINDLKQIQFVELKLNCGDRFYHLDKTSFRQKSDASKKAIGTNIPIAKKHLIVFDSSVLNQAKRFLYRINPVVSNDFVAIDVKELYTKFFN